MHNLVLPYRPVGEAHGLIFPKHKPFLLLRRKICKIIFYLKIYFLNKNEESKDDLEMQLFHGEGLQLVGGPVTQQAHDTVLHLQVFITSLAYLN